MVQVDVFWSYAIGAGLAVAASRQLAHPARRDEGVLDAPEVSRVVLFLATIFAPSGLFLLWAFPSWETMHVAAAGKGAIPAWLACLFALTNVTQGLLGFAVARWLIRRGSTYAAFLQWMAGYFGMFFILVHGWDGTGYQRFFSASPEALAAWEPATILAWLTSDVALALAVMGVFFLPPLLYMSATWLSEGHHLARRRADGGLLPAASRPALAAWNLGAIHLGALPAAIGASLLVRALGWAGGGVVFCVLAWALAVRPRSPFGWLYTRLLREPAATTRDVAASAEPTGSRAPALAPAGC